MRKKIKNNLIRLSAIFVSAVLCMTMIRGGLWPALHVKAETDRALNYDKTDVLDDLGSSTVEGKPFNVNDYPRNPFGTVQVITFAEYCYSQYENGNVNYALYVYVYNPALVEFAAISTQNKIEISSDFYFENEEGNPGTVKDYAKFPLIFCNASTGAYENRFLKFRIKDENKTIFNAEREREAATGSRYYHISGIELYENNSDKTTAQEYWVNKYFQFSGYAEGYGDSKFPFQCDAAGNAEAVQLKVQHTYYRTASSGKGKNYQNQLDTVYFAVPKRLFDTYGELQRIKAEWWEYKTKEFVVTSNAEFYNAVQQYLGKTVESKKGEISMNEPVLNDDIGYALANEMKTISSWGIETYESAKWGWNLAVSSRIEEICDRLTLLFLTDDIDGYDPYKTDTAGTVNGNLLYDHIIAYGKSYDSGRLPVKDGSISADLFESDIDDSRKIDNEQGKIQQGYSYYDFDADTDLQKLISWKDGDPSFWENWNEYGFWETIFGKIPSETGREISPIQVLKENDLKGTDQEISERLLVNIKDVQTIKDAYSDAVKVDPLDKTDEECYLVMFRFAASDYYAAPVDIYKSDLWGTVKKGQAYFARQSVFFDFDIIDLTFHKGGMYMVIPAVSDPIDIINGLTPPGDMGNNLPDWLKYVLLAIGLLIALPVLYWILKIVVWLIQIIFKGIASVFRGIGKSAKKRNEKKNKRKNE